MSLVREVGESRLVSMLASSMAAAERRFSKRNLVVAAAAAAPMVAPTTLKTVLREAVVRDGCWMGRE